MPCPPPRAADSASSRLAPVATTSPVSTETAAQLPGIIPAGSVAALLFAGTSLLPGFGIVEGGSLVGNESASVLSNIFSVEGSLACFDSAGLGRINSPDDSFSGKECFRYTVISRDLQFNPPRTHRCAYLTRTFISPCFSTTSTRTVPAWRSRNRSARP